MVGRRPLEANIPGSTPGSATMKAPRSELIFIFMSLGLGLSTLVYLFTAGESSMADFFGILVIIFLPTLSLYAISRFFYYFFPKARPIRKKANLLKVFIKKYRYYTHLLQKIIHIARLLVIYISKYLQKIIYRKKFAEIYDTTDEVYKLPKGRNIIFTNIERLGNMIIFHGKSRKKIIQRDLEQILKVCTKSSGSNNVTANLENGDPYLFKIVSWKKN